MLRTVRCALTLLTLMIVVVVSGCSGHAKPYAWIVKPGSLSPHRFGDVSSPSVGEVFTAGSGSWSGSPTGFAYAWKDCDSSGANCATASGSPTNAARYEVVSGDIGSTLRVAVTASYSGHPDATVTSEQTGVVGGASSAPTNTVLPAVSDTTNSGLYEAGDTVSATTGTWDNSPSSYSYQWMDEDSPISGATSSTYTLASADLDHTVDVVVTATNDAGTSDPAPSASSGVVVNPCDVTTSSWATAAGDINSGHSGKTICLNAGTYTTSGTDITGNNAAMTTLEATPGATQPTLSDAPSVAASNFRIEGFHLDNGLNDAGSGTVKIVGNYYHDCATGSCGALWRGTGVDSGGTVSELHNRMVNVRLTSDGESDSDAVGYSGCNANVVQNYNTFNTMNNHPFLGGSCTTEQIIGNEELNIYFQYSSHHVDCFEPWSGSGAGTFEDNRCTPQNPEGTCATDSVSGKCGADSLLSGDNTGAYTVKNNLIVDPAGTCMDMHSNGSTNNGANNADIENNTFVGCGGAGLTMTAASGGTSSGNTVKFNITDSLNFSSCSNFVSGGEDDNNSPDFSPTAHCGSHDTSVSTADSSFESTAPSDPNATYVPTVASGINQSWGYQAGCTSITVCHGRVGYDAHIPVP